MFCTSTTMSSMCAHIANDVLHIDDDVVDMAHDMDDDVLHIDDDVVDVAHDMDDDVLHIDDDVDIDVVDIVMSMFSLI